MGSTTVPLRTYPPRFGRKLVRLHPKFCRERVVDWSGIPDGVEQQSLQAFFRSLEWGDLWEDARMVSVLAYIRGSKSLQLGDWRPFFPTEL